MNTAVSFLNELKQRSSILYYTGLVHLLLFGAALVAVGFDGRLILGENPWFKPIKFTLSITAYVWTFAWFLAYLNWQAKKKRLVSGIISATMFAEIGIILLQAYRGVPSHFNNGSLFDGMLFMVMGISIAVNTVVNIWIWFAFLKDKNINSDFQLSPAFLSAVRLGILIFIVGSMEGGSMLAIGKHTVGAADGGPGLPLIHWSSIAGDLRIAHFFGLHSIQVIPLATYWVESKLAPTGRSFTYLFAFGYFAAFNFLYVQALLGLPLVGGV